jgi:hypothetical protein
VEETGKSLPDIWPELLDAEDLSFDFDFSDVDSDFEDMPPLQEVSELDSDVDSDGDSMRPIQFWTNIWKNRCQ